MRKALITLIIYSSFVMGGNIKRPSPNYTPDPFKKNNVSKIGDHPFPTNPMNDRARGYLLQGKAQTAILNYGNYIDIEVNPNGAWGEYSYLYEVSFLAGIPGHSYSSNYNWENIETVTDDDGMPIYSIWESQDAYESWYKNGDTNFVGILFDAADDDGIWEPDSISKKNSVYEINKGNQWLIKDDENKVIISTVGDLNPNKSSSRIGFIYPWALRPKLISREEQFDYYDYGDDQQEWTADDHYVYYGANTAESCLSYYSPTFNTDWHASTNARSITHNTETSAGDLFGNTYVTDPSDTYPLLAHSAYGSTWPKKLNPLTNQLESFWPGWWAEDYNINLPGCSQSRKDPDCWEDAPGRFISDMDIYLEFDDRWAHRGNQVNTNNEYEQTGYPMGLRVMSEAHSYGVSYAEDILFVTVKVRNESGDWCAEDEYGAPVLDEFGNQTCGEGMIMPDGTKLNSGKGFNYSGVTLGFWNDGVILTSDKYGNSSYWSSADDYMKYYWEVFEINDERMLISMAMIGDYDGFSGVSGYAMNPNIPSPGNEFGLVATQLLDSPKATTPVDLDQDGVIDIFPGEPLKMTDWHWLDWYLRPGVTHPESLSGDCYAGTPGCPQARNKEEIFYKIMIGDTTNISQNEHAWHFHTDDPGTDLPEDLNPHFDSLEGIEEEMVFQRPPEGVDPLVLMNCGPFDFPVGREVPFSFCIIFGQDEEDLINFKDNSYQQLKSEIDVNKAKHNLEITKSQYRPQLGFSMRYTQYDIDEDAEDNDLRGGIYFSLPLFNFGRGTAQINAGKAKINQAKIYRDQTTRDSENINAQIFGAFYGSLQARNRILESYNNVKLQRETFEIRMVGSSFAIPALLEAVAKEISLYEQLVNNEKKLLMADLNRRHLNRQLLNRFYISF